MLNEETMEKLYSMRLKAMAEGLREQMENPGASALSFEERMAMLVDREWTFRQERGLRRRLKGARLKQEACIEDMDWRHPRGLDRPLLRALATCRWIRSHQNLIITGPTGVGKTFIACALANKACREGLTACYTRAPRLFHDIAMARADGSYVKLMGRLAKTDLLIIDDWGIHPIGDTERRDLIEVIEDRNLSRSTMVTSQLPVANWHDYIGEPTLADAILDRLIHNAHRMELKGESLRKKRSNLTQADH